MQAVECSSQVETRTTSPSQFEATRARIQARAALRQGGVMQIRRIQAHDLQWLPALADLLIDSVHQGATLGFLAPLSRYAALDYWHSVYARLGNRQALWIACEGGSHGPLQGAVQLKLEAPPNAHHRGEVQRLMVHSQERGRGIARHLLAALESSAADLGRHLLVLDAPQDSHSERVFLHLGWQHGGKIPGFESSAEGEMQGAVMLYKQMPRLC